MKETQEVLRVPETTSQRLGELAAVEGMTAQAALDMVIGAGIELYERGRVERLERLEDIHLQLAELKTLIHLLGPESLGTNLLLTHWATRTGSLQVTEEELTQEFRTVARMEWAVEVSKRGIVPPVSDADAAAEVTPASVE